MTRPVLIVDTREQNPLEFLPYKERFRAIVRMKLDAADYSLLDLEHELAFERKSLSDLVSTLTQPDNQKRFLAEMERLANHRYAAIIVEATYRQVASPYKYSRVSPLKVLGLLQAIQVRYNVDVIFSGSRENSELIIVNKIGALYG